MKALLLLWFVLLDSRLGLSCNTRYQMTDACNQDYGTTLHVFNDVSSVAACTVLCGEDNSCGSVLFDAESKTCTTNSGLAKEMFTGCGLKYAEFIQSNCKTLSSLGNSCETSDDCYESTCSDGVCVCAAGYSLDPSSNACVEECINYGSTFTKFEGHLIAGYNSQKITESNADDCKAACINVDPGDFVCRTAELSSTGDCYLSEETARTQSESFVESSDYTYFQRNCK